MKHTPKDLAQPPSPSPDPAPSPDPLPLLPLEYCVEGLAQAWAMAPLESSRVGRALVRLWAVRCLYALHCPGE